MPPAAPLPTTMTSHGPDFGVMDEAIRFDSETTPPRLRVRVGSDMDFFQDVGCRMSDAGCRIECHAAVHTRHPACCASCIRDPTSDILHPASCIRHPPASCIRHPA